jgi:hypothetical protein
MLIIIDIAGHHRVEFELSQLLARWANYTYGQLAKHHNTPTIYHIHATEVQPFGQVFTFKNSNQNKKVTVVEHNILFFFRIDLFIISLVIFFTSN